MPVLEINLDIPAEQEALRRLDDVQAWIAAWTPYLGISALIRTERSWQTLGTQKLPAKLILNEAEEAVSWIGKTDEWSRVIIRYTSLIREWPALTDVLCKHYSFLAESGEADYSRLAQTLKWINANPKSNLYPRQIPVAGIDSKWVENNKKILCELIAAINGVDSAGFYQTCGLKPLPQIIRIRILDPQLRSLTGNLCDISVPLEEAANLIIRPAKVFIVENLQTGLAFGNLNGSIVVMGLGYGVDVLEKNLWLKNTRCIYWGDIDTHGFAILSQARKYLPALESILMDEAALLGHRQLWVEEKKQHPAIELPLLTNDEQKVYKSLKDNVWGQNIRLEQERICWDTAWNVIKEIAEKK